MFRPVYFARAQIADQQLITTEHVQRQKAIAIVVTVEETAFLLSMSPVIGRIKIQNQLCRRFIERSDKLFDQYLMNRQCRLSIQTILQTAERRGTAQHLILFNYALKSQIVTQFVMVIEIFVALTQSIDPLAQQGQLIMSDIARIPWIGQGRVNGFEQPQVPVGLAKQQQTAVTGDVTAGKIRLNPATFYRWKSKTTLGTVCHRQDLVRFQSRPLNFIGLHRSCPLYL